MRLTRINPKKPNVVVLSEGLWKRRFASDSSVIGRSITLDGESYAVIGVMPQGFDYPPGVKGTDLWMPLKLTPEDADVRGSHYLFVVGRRKPGVGRGQALADMKQIAARLAKLYPQNQFGRSVRIKSLEENFVGRTRPALLILLGAVGLVLLIACANVANLLLARAAIREREVSIRAALGAGRWRMARLFLIESVMLGLAGGILGALLASWGVKALLLLAADQLPRNTEITFDAGVFAFMLGVCLATGLLFGLAPAAHALSNDLQSGQREGGGKGAVHGASARFRGALVVAGIALSFILLVGAGLLMKFFLQLRDVNPGCRHRERPHLPMAAPETKYPKNQPARRQSTSAGAYPYTPLRARGRRNLTAAAAIVGLQRRFWNRRSCSV